MPDAAGLNYWIGQYQGEADLDTLSQAFAGSTEFQQTYGSLDNADFVILVYRNVLGREPDGDGLQFWTDQLTGGGLTRGQMMIGFSESAEYRGMTSSEITVTLLYLGMLQRAPEEDGFNYWIGVLDSGVSAAGLIDNFLQSAEYYQRFLP